MNNTKIVLHGRSVYFGCCRYDFMITENFDVTLIEVNSNPCLEFACDMLERLLVDVMDDAFM